MAEPTLSEIVNIPANSSLATGNPGVVFDQRELVRNLNQAAQFKADNDLKKYQFFVNNLKDVYKDAGEIASMDVMTEDQPYLKKQASQIFADILKDPQAIYSPKLQQKLGALKGEATESKQNKLFDLAHRQFINQNAELNTDSNKQKIEEFRGLPLGQRKAYSLDMPTLFDYEGYRNTLLTHPTVKTAFSQSSISPDNQFIKEVSGNKYDRNKFLGAWNAGLNAQQDKYGHSIKGAAQQMFNQLSDSDKQYWNKNGGLEGFWNYTGQLAFGGDKDVMETVKENISPNPGYLEKQKLGLGWANYALGRERLNKSDNEDVLGANSVLQEAASIISKGTPIAVDNYKGTGKKKVVSEISDPTILQTFGTIDKEGNMVNRPDVIQYDKDSDELNLVYYEKEKDEYGKFTGSIKKTASGKNIVDRTVPINSRTWLKQKVKQTFPNKDIGGVNNIVETAFEKSGGNLVSLTDLFLNGGKKEAAPPAKVEELRTKYKY